MALKRLLRHYSNLRIPDTQLATAFPYYLSRLALSAYKRLIGPTSSYIPTFYNVITTLITTFKTLYLRMVYKNEARVLSLRGTLSNYPEKTPLECLEALVKAIRSLAPYLPSIRRAPDE